MKFYVMLTLHPNNVAGGDSLLYFCLDSGQSSQESRQHKDLNGTEQGVRGIMNLHISGGGCVNGGTTKCIGKLEFSYGC